MAVESRVPTYGNHFLEPGSRSEQLYQRARARLPGGNTRTSVYSPPFPYYAARGQGCRLVDVDGQERLDFFNNHASLLHGHAHPTVIAAAQRQMVLGTAFGTPTQMEVELAEAIAARAPVLEQMRFANSGTEAVMMAIRAARAFTGRPGIAKFEGCYHGSYDPTEVSVLPEPEDWGDPAAPSSVAASDGLAPGTLEQVVVLPFNDLEACEALLSQRWRDVAAVVVDPLPHQAGLPVPRPGFLPGLHRLAQRFGILVISDEVVSFRLSYAGAHSLFGYQPDLVALGKVVGGGFPVGVVGGSAEVMAVFDPTSGQPRVPHAGTFNGNPVTMAAGLATLELWTPSEVARLNRLGDDLRQRANAVLSRRGLRARFTGLGSLFRLVGTDQPIASYRDARVSPDQAVLLRELWLRLLGQGIVLGGTGLGCPSTPMGEAEVEAFVAALDRATEQ